MPSHSPNPNRTPKSAPGPRSDIKKRPTRRGRRNRSQNQKEARAPQPLTPELAIAAEKAWREELDKTCAAFRAAGGGDAALQVNTGAASSKLSIKLTKDAHKKALNSMRTLRRYLEEDACLPEYLRKAWIEKDEYVQMIDRNPAVFVAYFHMRIHELAKERREAKRSPAQIPTGLAQDGALVPNECTAGKGIGGNALSKTTEL